MTDPVPPPTPTGHPVADRVVSGLIDLTESLLPGRAVAYYLTGSYATGNPRPTSDLDLFVILRADSTPAQVAGLQATYRRCGKLTPMLLDATVVTEPELRVLGSRWVPVDRRLVAGVDVLAAPLPAAPPAVDLRRQMDGAAAVLGNFYARGGPLPHPLRPADPADPWLGFASRPVRLPDGREEPGLRRLATTTYWAASALLLYRAGVWEVRKGRVLAERFRAALGDEWSGLLGGVFGRCRDDWDYRLPAGPADRAELRGWCEQAVRFHAEFVDVYRAYRDAERPPGGPDGGR